MPSSRQLGLVVARYSAPRAGREERPPRVAGVDVAERRAGAGRRDGAEWSSGSSRTAREGPRERRPRRRPRRCGGRTAISRSRASSPSTGSRSRRAARPRRAGPRSASTRAPIGAPRRRARAVVLHVGCVGTTSSGWLPAWPAGPHGVHHGLRLARVGGPADERGGKHPSWRTGGRGSAASSGASEALHACVPTASGRARRARVRPARQAALRPPTAPRGLDRLDPPRLLLGVGRLRALLRPRLVELHAPLALLVWLSARRARKLRPLRPRKPVTAAAV